MERQWFYSHLGQKVLGPFTSRELKTLASTGELGPNDKVRRRGMAQPVIALRIKGLFGYLTGKRHDLTKPHPAS